jgi:hypothetical protein
MKKMKKHRIAAIIRLSLQSSNQPINKLISERRILIIKRKLWRKRSKRNKKGELKRKRATYRL